ncbi:hypothetical protein [Thermogutta sp.]|uniref:hypothetical protein n=1 Tax=Thermogutta sp. TaxID=1962930 RepID=UPI00321FF8DA
MNFTEMVTIIAALTEATKRIVKSITGADLGDVSIAVAIAYGVIVSVASAYRVGADPVNAALVGVIAGLSASGLYSIATRLRDGREHKGEES